MADRKLNLGLLIAGAVFAIFPVQASANDLKKMGDIFKSALQKKTPSSPPQRDVATQGVIENKNSEKFINPEKVGDLQCEVSFDMDGQVFPAFVTSFQEAAKQSLNKKRPPYTLGSFNGAFSVYAQGNKPNAKIKVIVYPNNFITEQTEFDYVLPDPSIVYEVSPMVAWDFQKLTGLSQPTNETFKIGLQAEGQPVKNQVFQPRIRSINDSIFNFIDREGKPQPAIVGMFAAFVNENHPIIDQILSEAKELAIKAKIKNISFGGYSSGAANPIQQVATIWYLFQTKHFVYSSITQESGTSSRVRAQHVRSIGDSYSATQANCVDGSVLFASILMKLGIKPVLVMHPGHMYLMFYAEQGNKQPVFVETTMLGTFQPKKGLFHTDSGEFQKSFQSFLQANQVATNTFNQDRAHYQKRESGYNLLDIETLRNLGITPINR